MAPDGKIPTSVLLALGLAGCTHSSVCLSYAVCLQDTYDGDTDDTWGVCLSIAESGETAVDTADTGDTGCDSGDTGCGEPETSAVVGRRGAGVAERTQAVRALTEALPRDIVLRLLSD